MRFRLTHLVPLVLLSSVAACFRYVERTRPLTGAECSHGPPLPHAFARSWPDSSGGTGLRGRVVNAQAVDSARRALASAAVSIEGTTLRALTDDAGRFQIPNVAPGRYVVLTRRVAFHPRRDSVVVSATAATVLEVGLESSPLDGCPGFMVVVERKRVWRWPWQ